MPERCQEEEEEERKEGREGVASAGLVSIPCTSHHVFPADSSPPLPPNAPSRVVTFSDTLTVVLVPRVHARDSSTSGSDSVYFYLSQDYQRFSRQRDLEVADCMCEEGLGSRQEALLFLYLLEGTAGGLMTDHNCNNLSWQGEEE
jgi:hypothetical protein